MSSASFVSPPTPIVHSWFVGTGISVGTAPRISGSGALTHAPAVELYPVLFDPDDMLNEGEK